MARRDQRVLLKKSQDGEGRQIFILLHKIILGGKSPREVSKSDRSRGLADWEKNTPHQYPRTERSLFPEWKMASLHRRGKEYVTLEKPGKESCGESERA